MAQKPVLGKGLASLLPGAAQSTGDESKARSAAGVIPNPPPAPAELQKENLAEAQVVTNPPSVVVRESTPNKDRHPGITLAQLESIQANPFQPRREFVQSQIDELANSIEENGIIQPLVVRKSGDGFELIAGERRFRAAKQLGLERVPVVIRRSTDRESLELALVENIQRENLNCIDEALAYFQLSQEFAMTQEEVAKRVGKDRSTVANHLRLLKLPELVIEDLRSGKISFGHGKILVGLSGTEHRLKLHREIIDNQLSVRATETRSDEIKQGIALSESRVKKQKQAMTAIESRLQQMAQDLTRQWATKVDIKGDEKKGKITLHYKNRQELDRLTTLLQNKTLWDNPPT